MIRVLTLLVLLGASVPARAVNGCEVLLCLAGNWRAIPQCVSPVREVFRDLARGKPFPTCAFVSAPQGTSGVGSSASNQWAGPRNCPPQYLQTVLMGEQEPVTQCAYDGVIRVRVDGAEWSEVWWSMSGASVTNYAPAARAALGVERTQFEIDRAGWEAARKPTNVEADR